MGVTAAEQGPLEIRPDMTSAIDAERLASETGVATDRILDGNELAIEMLRDEALTAEPSRPAVAVFPVSTEEVASVLAFADRERIPVTARGAGTGMCGGCVPRPGGILVCFERMNRILEIDTANHTVRLQPGVRLQELDEETAKHGLVYPIYPGEMSATLGGNVATNAGGMRAVKYGVTRHQVLGLEAVLPGGTVIRTGGSFVKSSSGYDLTQLIVGSEGTLALVTEVTLRLFPRPKYSSTLLVPFASLREVTEAVPKLVASGVAPLILEYIDALSMAATTANVGIDLAMPEPVKEAALAYLVVVLESDHQNRLEEDVEAVANLAAELGGLDVYVLSAATATKLLDAREKAFWVAKQHGADDIVDVVVPRTRIADYMEAVARVASGTGSLIAGCGHVGDGNVHLSVFQPDPVLRETAMSKVLGVGVELGGAVSAEHGIGREKKSFFLALEDRAKIELMRRIKLAFDPNGIMNPGTIFD
jgi:glycolate oxidase